MGLSSAIKKDITANSLNAYQARQLKHDRTYHREIWSLGVSRGMKHVALHLIKYLANLSALPVSSNENKRALIDSFIMIISAGNLLNFPFCAVLDVSSSPSEETLDDSFVDEYIRLLAEMAKACEATDHQEDYPIRAVWNRNLKSFFYVATDGS